MLGSQPIVLSHIDPTISQWQDVAYEDTFSTASLATMSEDGRWGLLIALDDELLNAVRRNN